MRFWRKARNRRLGRSEVLEVKMRVEPGRRAWRRGLVLAAVVALGVAGGAWGAMRGWDWAGRRLLDNGLFALQTLEITTEGVWLKPDQIREWAGVKEGDNLLRVDLVRIRRDLELVPQIETVSAECVLPHVLRIEVAERDPVLRILVMEPEGADGLAPAVFYLDRAAVVMPPLPAMRASAQVAQAFEALPVLRGLSAAELRPGQSVATPAVMGALRLLATFEKSGLARATDLRAIDVSSPEVLKVVTGAGAEVTLPYEGIEEVLERWQLVHEAGGRMAKAVASMDLSITNNCPVLWVEASQVPPPKAKPTKPPRVRRKHV
jgi:cell division septal protein FtsQ